MTHTQLWDGEKENWVCHQKACCGFAAYDDVIWTSHLSFFFFFNLFIYLFIFGCVGSSSLCEGFLQLRRAGATLHRGARASHYRGLSCWEHRLQTHRLSSCGSRAQLLRGMWDPPRPGLKPVSPALAGRFSTTAPPGKPNLSFLSLGFCKHKMGISGICLYHLNFSREAETSIWSNLN